MIPTVDILSLPLAFYCLYHVCLLDSIKFNDDVVVVDLSVKEYINGVNATHVLPNVVVDKTLDVHLDNVHFDHLMIEGNLEIKSGKVNDIDIIALNASAIRLDTEQLIEGSMVFKQVCFTVPQQKYDIMNPLISL